MVFLTPLDLLPLPNVTTMLNCGGASKAQFVKDLHAKAHSYIEKRSNNILIELTRVNHKMSLRKEIKSQIRGKILFKNGSLIRT
ncbi:hypothetical protein CR513_34406, partial [Mucuna pruriens]